MRLAVEASRTHENAGWPRECTHLEPVLREVQQSIDPGRIDGWEQMDSDTQQARVDEIYRAHLVQTIQNIRSESTVLAGLVETGRIEVVPAMYDVRTGAVDFFSRS